MRERAFYPQAIESGQQHRWWQLYTHETQMQEELTRIARKDQQGLPPHEEELQRIQVLRHGIHMLQTAIRSNICSTLTECDEYNLEERIGEIQAAQHEQMYTYLNDRKIIDFVSSEAKKHRGWNHWASISAADDLESLAAANPKHTRFGTYVELAFLQRHIERMDDPDDGITPYAVETQKEKLAHFDDAYHRRGVYLIRDWMVEHEVTDLDIATDAVKDEYANVKTWIGDQSPSLRRVFHGMLIRLTPWAKKEATLVAPLSISSPTFKKPGRRD